MEVVLLDRPVSDAPSRTSALLTHLPYARAGRREMPGFSVSTYCDLSILEPDTK